MAAANPFAFRPLQVTFWTTVVYLALVIPLIYIQESVPSAPPESALPTGISLAEAWADLGNLTQYFHPANSHANDDVRAFLLQRIRQILDRNGASWMTVEDRVAMSSLPQSTSSSSDDATHAHLTDPDAVIFDDLLANISFPVSYAGGRRSALYYEGTNVYVYIRGTRDEAGNWWQAPANTPRAISMKKQIVLVNAHFDSVSSGFGATDDGVGVVSGLQLLRYFSTPGRQPERGIVLLLNNAEEDFLLGATAFTNSPLAPFIGTFVNLEGAGAGGRAVLFRSTDLEVMTAYRQSPHPYGTVVASDGFKMNWVRSETDYRVWVNALGYRGLDIAFMKPRVRYHTQQDDRRHTSKDSVWHMLSSAIASAQGLSGFAGNKVDKSITDAVWFDLFGDSLVLFALRGLFAWSLTILIVSPLLLALVLFLLYKFDRDYLFRASAVLPDRAPEASRIALGGWKGFFRFPLALVVAGAFVFGAALLLRKVQPFIIYSSLYAVLTLTATLFYFVFWCIMRGANFARPSAFHRAYSLFWLFLISWALLVATAALENRNRIASGYIIVFWASSVFLAFLISLLENFSLKTKSAYIEGLDHRDDVYSGDTPDGDRNNSHESDALIAPSSDEVISNESAIEDEPSDEGEGAGAARLNDDAPTETSPLIGGNVRNNRLPTFATGYRRSLSALLEERRQAAAAEDENLGRGAHRHPYGCEQEWSKNLPTWTWLLQFLILGPFNIILAGQLLLSLASAVQQTGTDGSDLLMPYLLVVGFTIFVLSPLTPFIHRVTRHVPLFLFAAFVGTLIYSLTVFPFSATSPYKFAIRQTFSIDHGNTSVILTGYKGYLAEIITSLPSAASRPWSCTDANGRQTGLLDCSFDGTGLEPRVEDPDKPFTGSYKGLISINATRVGTFRASVEINAVNTKSCALRFENPAKAVSVRGGLELDTRFDFDPSPAPKDGNWEIGDFTLWRRDWETPWVVDVEWMGAEISSDAGIGQEEEAGLAGTVICRWADANAPRAVPAVDEAWKYAPPWAILTIKSNPPLVQGSKIFSV